MALEKVHRQGAVGSFILILFGWVLGGIALSAREMIHSSLLIVCLMIFVFLCFLAPPLFFLWEFVTYLHVRGMARDEPAVRKLLLDEQSFTQEMAEWMVARQRLIRAMGRAAGWLVFWLAGEMVGIFTGMLGVLFVLVCLPGTLWCALLLFARVVGFFWVTIGLRRGAGVRGAAIGN